MIELSPAGEAIFLVGRVLFGAVLAYMSINHFANADYMAGYAESKGVPAGKFSVVASGVMMLLGGIGIAVGAYPVLAAGALAAFFVVSTPVMHDFWAVPEEQAQDEQIQFLKNTALLGGSLVFLALGGLEWAYAVNVGLFL